MTEQLSAAQRQAVRRNLALVDKLLTLEGVARHESRFDGEIALVASSGSRAAIDAVIEELLGKPAKPTDEEVSAELRENALLETIGGIRKSQTLYLQDLGGGLTFYLAYWPWSGGARFTIKMGVYLPAED
jgi:hypothetical protein